MTDRIGDLEWEQRVLDWARHEGPAASQRIPFGPLIRDAWLEGEFPDTKLVLALAPRVREPEHEAVFSVWDRSLSPWITVPEGLPPANEFVAGLIEMINEPPYPQREPTRG